VLKAMQMDDEAAAGDGLDQSERAVLVALADGQSAADIAAALRIPEQMVGIQMANVLAKLHRQHAAPHREQAAPTACGRAGAVGAGGVDERRGPSGR